MGINFEEKYGIKDYDKKLVACINKVGKTIGDNINKCFDKCFEKFKDQMNYLKFVKYKNGNGLKFQEEYCKDLKKEVKEWLDSLHEKDDMRKWDASGLQIKDAYKHFVSKCKDMNVTESNEFYIPQKNLFDYMKIDYKDNALDPWKTGLNLVIVMLLDGVHEGNYPEDFIDAIRNITLVPFDNGISSAEDVGWGPVNKDMLEDMLKDEEIYKEFMLQFGLFDEFK